MSRSTSVNPGLSPGRWRRLFILRARIWARIRSNSEFVTHYVWKYRKFVGLGLSALLLVDLLEILPPLLLKHSVDLIVDKGPPSGLVKLAVLYAVITVIQALCRYAWRMFLIRASFMSGRDLRARFAKHLFSLSVSFFEKRRVGDLLSLSTNDSEAVRMAIGAGLLTLADALFYFILVPAAMWMLSPSLTILAFLPLAFVPWFVMKNEGRLHSQFEEVQESFSRISAMAQENLNGIRVVKSFAIEDVMLSRFKRAGEEFIQRNLDLARTQSTFGPTLDFAMTFGLVLLLYIGGRGVISDAVTIGTFVAFQRYIQKMIWPMTAVGLAITMYQRAAASTGRMKEVLALQSLVPDAENPILPEGAGAPNWKTPGKIEFRQLTFAFPESTVSVLQEISLVVEPGQRVAFVGTVGSGKSTLLALIPRLYPVARGMLIIDGVDVNDWPLDTLRAQMGYVGQEVFLFSETVAENIAFGVRGADTAELAQEAAKLSSVHADALGLVGGYETMLGERGVNLSGGQKQRLTIARAVAPHPSILILDDALSSVDVQTEEKILTGLRGRTGRKTELIAAHRISTVKDADKIVVLEKGRIVQQGTHLKLLQSKTSPYGRFYEQQRLKEELEHYVQRELRL